VEIVAQEPAHDEPRAKLRAEDPIAPPSGDDELDVFPRRHLIGDVGISPKPSARDHAVEAELATELAERGVEALAHAAPPKARRDVDVGQVKRSTLGVVAREEAAVGDAEPGVLAEHVDVRRRNERRDGAGELAVDLGDELAGGEPLDMGAQLLGAEDDAVLDEIGIGRGIERDEGGDVGELGAADKDCVVGCHGGSSGCPMACREGKFASPR
jgi:hypothetical protein